MNILVLAVPTDTATLDMVRQHFSDATIRPLSVCFYRRDYVGRISREAARHFYETQVKGKYEAVVFREIPPWMEAELVSVLADRNVQPWLLAAEGLKRLESPSKESVNDNPFRRHLAL